MDKMLEAIKIVLSERRPLDAWLDFNLREVREGPVSYFKVKDFMSGNWLLKICVDAGLGKLIVKAVKCPPGKPYFDVEGESMVFQRSFQHGFLYDLISVPMMDENGRIRRRRVSVVEEIPPLIRDNFKIVTHREATGKDSPLGRLLATLTPEGELRSTLILFLLERVWPLASKTPREAYEEMRIDAEQSRKPPFYTTQRKLLNAIRRVQMARLVDVYEMVKAKFDEDEYLKALHDLTEAGKISHPQVGYVKVGRGVKTISEYHEEQRPPET